MLSYVLRRIAVALLLAWGVATVTFALVWWAPGDSRDVLLLSGGLPSGASPLPPSSAVASYGEWIVDLLHGDLGYSEFQGRPVTAVFGSALPHTVALSTLGLLFAAVLGIGIGVVQAARAGGFVDRLLNVLTTIAYSAPSFWMGIVLAGAFIYWPMANGRSAWFPLSGVAPPRGVSSIFDYVPHLLLPALTLGIVLGAGVARFTRAAMVEALNQEYVRSARARGLSEMRVLLRHGLRNALVPLVSLLGVYVPVLLTGTVFVEVVFERVGVGREMVRAISTQDLPVVLGGALLFGFATVLGNLGADLLYGWADPRIGDPARG